MKALLLVPLVILSFVSVDAQDTQQDTQHEMDLVVSDQDMILLFAGFIIAIVGLCVFLARDVILRRKTTYDSEELGSKRDRTYEKYHSDWGDDYAKADPGKTSGEFMAEPDSELPDYYKILNLSRNATPKEIKQQYRKMAKESHPDRANKMEPKTSMAETSMAEINRAYEVLSDPRSRAKYDSCLD